MSVARQYFDDWLRWRAGRQQTGYEKMLLFVSSFLLPFDCYLLRFGEGAEIPPHTDPVTEKRHFRLNIVLWHARHGGEFVCSDPIYASARIKLFRPDVASHGVTRVEAGKRIVLSLG